MWRENPHSFAAGAGQEAVTLTFRSVNARDWKYEERMYHRVYEARLDTPWGPRYFWYCFSEQDFPFGHQCEAYLLKRDAPFEPLRPYLEAGAEEPLRFGGILQSSQAGVLVFARPEGDGR